MSDSRRPLRPLLPKPQPTPDTMADAEKSVPEQSVPEKSIPEQSVLKQEEVLYLILTTYSTGPAKPPVSMSQSFSTVLKETNTESHERFRRVLAAKNITADDPTVHNDKIRLAPKRHTIDGETAREVVEVKEFRRDVIPW